MNIGLLQIINSFLNTKQINAYDAVRDTIQTFDKVAYKAVPVMGEIRRNPSTTMRPLASDKDGTVYGYSLVSNRYLASSVDGGVTLTQGLLFDEPIQAVVISATHIIVSTWTDTTTAGKIYVGSKSNGVAGPFTLKITMDIGVYGVSFSMNSFYDQLGTDGLYKKNIVLIGEYGRKTLPNPAKRVYLSVDGGDTFSTIFTGEEITDQHIHTVVYDQYSGRLCMWIGDEFNKTGLYFSDDMGATWRKVYPTLDKDQGGVDNVNSTIIVPTPKYLLFCSDKFPNVAIWRWSREREVLEDMNGGDITKALHIAHPICVQKSPNIQPYFSRGWVRVSDMEFYIGIGSSSTDPKKSYIIATGDGGETLHTIFCDNIPSGGYVGLDSKICLSTNNEIIARYSDATGGGTLIFTIPEWKVG